MLKILENLYTRHSKKMGLRCISNPVGQIIPSSTSQNRGCSFIWLRLGRKNPGQKFSAIRMGGAVTGNNCLLKKAVHAAKEVFLKNCLAILLIFCGFLATNVHAMGIGNRLYSGNVWIHQRAVRDIEDVRKLLADGINVDVTDQNDTTMLHYAAFSNNKAIAKLLIHAGISLDKKDKDGKTALHYAISQNHQSLALLIAAVRVYQGMGLSEFESVMPKIVQIGESLALHVLQADSGGSEYPIGRTRDEASVIEFLKALKKPKLKSRI